MSASETRVLFERARNGAPDAVNAFYERCGRKLLPLIRLRLGRTLRAELESRDILQVVLCKAFQRLSQVEDPSAVMGWLSRMAENEIRDHADYHRRERRDAARRAPIDEAGQAPAPVRQALSLAIMNERAERLERALETLPAAQREVIVLRAYEELTFPQIAVRLGRTDDACRMAYARAMAALTVAVAED